MGLPAVRIPPRCRPSVIGWARAPSGCSFQRWMSRLPLPLTEHDRAAGYWWELSMRQIEVSRTLVFDAPRHARSFFEALVADNLDIGRPDTGGTDLPRAPTPGQAPAVDCVPKTKIVTRGTEVTVNAFYETPASNSI